MVDHRSAVESTLAFHETTKHTVHSVRGGTHVLDATNMPRPWKLYDLDLPTTPLPDSLTRSGAAVQDVLLGSNDVEDDAAGPTLTQLASVLQLSAGVTRQLHIGEFRMNFRAAACTGALYHIELYVICGPLEGLPAGVYHYGVHDNALRQLRDGDFRGAVARARGTEDRAPLVTIAYTSTFWRNAWKYQERAYRHSFWDAGTILANSLAAARANGLPAQVFTRFLDQPINDLVDVDGLTEASVALLTLGARQPAPAIEAPARLGLSVAALSRAPIDYPLIRTAHAGTSLRAYASLVLPRVDSTTAAAKADREPVALPHGEPMTATLEDVILKRGSSRRFAREPIPFPKLAAILDAVGQPTPLDGPNGVRPLNDAYLLANNVDGLAPGIYRHRPESRSLEHVSSRPTQALAQHLALDQALGGDAAGVLFFVAHLPTVVDTLGARGYRTAHLDASIRAGRGYLAAYAIELGATGLTFYDDETVQALGAPAESAVTFLLAGGLAGAKPIR